MISYVKVYLDLVLKVKLLPNCGLQFRKLKLMESNGLGKF